MTDDDPDDSGSGSGGGGGGGGVLWLVGFLFTFIFRYPKISLVLGAIGAYWFFAVRTPPQPTTTPRTVSTPGTRQQHPPTKPGSSTFGTGATLDPKVYATTLVHEPLAAGALPSRVSLLEFAPPRRSQGHQGSCVGWATSYAARSILHAHQTGQRLAFSPSFTYNQVARPDCNGTFLKKALDELQRIGDLPFDEFAYDQNSCSTQPSSQQQQRAAEYRIVGYQRLSLDAADFANNPLAIKQHLAQSAPVVIGMRVGGTFEHMDGVRVWHPTAADYAERGDWGGHAMAVIGYDDTLEGGAFQLMNSWGTHWGESGVAFVRYKDFDHFVKEAYGLYPMGSGKSDDPNQHVRFSLVETGTQRHIPLAAAGGITFRTTTPIKKGTRFKVELSATRACYTYLFGQETDGSSYVLFPYNEQHSPYCGTTGTRIFPRKQSLTADNIGTRDSLAMVISGEALDYRALNDKITRAPGKSYADKLLSALALRTKDQARVGADNRVELDALGGKADKLHALVLEFDKQ
jgi:hypothetical protein